MNKKLLLIIILILIISLACGSEYKITFLDGTSITVTYDSCIKQDTDVLCWAGKEWSSMPAAVYSNVESLK